MSEEIVFYTNPMSRGRIARWMLEEVGQPYRTEVLQYGTTMKAPEYLAINPMGKVPAIKHGDAVVTECAAICAYLAEAFPDANLGPKNNAERARFYRWMFFSAGPVEAASTNTAMGVVVPPERKGMVGYGSLSEVVDALESAVKDREFIAAGHFTAADVYVGSQIGWGMQFGWLEKRPAFEAYFARISARPAAVRARELDDALMAEQQKPA